MKNTCSRYDPEMISRFSDRELPEDEYDGIKRHMENCTQCRKRAEEYRQISRSLEKGLYRETDALPAGLLEKNVLSRINRGNSSSHHRFPILKRIYLQAAFIAVIMIGAGTFYMEYPTVAPGPSAIVNYVEGDASSVMIFETEKEKHTVIWYTET